MSGYHSLSLTRRDVLRGLSAAGACLFGLGAESAGAEPALETTAIRVLLDPDFPSLCYAPQYLAEEFLRMEGFTEIISTGYGDSVSDAEALHRNHVDFGAGLGAQYVTAADAGQQITILSGLHAGCVETFANARVNDIRDIAGKRLVASGPGGPEHISLSMVIAFVGGDPNDAQWVWEPDHTKWPEMFASGHIDVVSAFPPQTYRLREMGVGHVILNTTFDDPWRHFFCCMVAARRGYAEQYPVATKRALRAFIKANQFCQFQQDLAARLLVERGATDRIDFARTVLEEVPYGAWRDYDPRDTIRFYALRLREAGIVRGTPSEILERGAEFRFLDEIRRELKV